MRWQPPIIAILIGFLTTTTFNSLGWLQISERQLYDYYLKLRPQELQDRKIVIVGLNEKDIEQFGFPISDDTLATLLTKIKAQNPRAIALWRASVIALWVRCAIALWVRCAITRWVRSAIASRDNF